MGSRASEVTHDLVVLGDDVDDVHAKVGEGSAERSDPPGGLVRDSAGGHFTQGSELARIDDRRKAVDERSVIVERAHRGAYMMTATPNRQTADPITS